MNLKEIKNTYHNKICDLHRIHKDLAKKGKNILLLKEIESYTNQLKQLINQYQ